MRWHSPFIVILAAGCREPALPVVPPVEIQPVEATAIHNVFRVSGRVYSGGSPEGEAGFAELERLGVKTIISVDGAKPDVDTAHKHGLTYVHLPFGYDGIPREKLIALAQAAERAPGPIYVHCHHGKHRGPAAVAAIQLCLDPSWDASKAESWLKMAGADPRYTGLYDVPRTFTRPTPEELSEAPASFPSISTVPDLARYMVEIDDRWEHLRLVKAAGWAVPKNHPDIDPPHEAVQLVEHYREAARLEGAKKRGPEFTKLLGDAEVNATELEQALRASPIDQERVGKVFAKNAATCASCHEKFRDRPGGARSRYLQSAFPLTARCVRGTERRSAINGELTADQDTTCLERSEKVCDTHACASREK
jgi:protein tyrosine phosphatase (PTP) superfamily phosphohydrolase (DUF442 family)